jgi:hypothetical protein
VISITYARPLDWRSVEACPRAGKMGLRIQFAVPSKEQPLLWQFRHRKKPPLGLAQRRLSQYEATIYEDYTPYKKGVELRAAPALAHRGQR